jgi:ribosomal protein S18 acetylase RimI-like enzyme
VERVTAAAVRPLRLLVLRPGGAPEDAVWPADDHVAAGHFGVREGRAGAARLVAAATVVPEPHPVDPRPGDWRLRGMATLPSARGRGLGGALAGACVAHAASSGAERVWLHARVGAVGLYERCGFTAESEVFEVPGIGPHVRMARSVLARR